MFRISFVLCEVDMSWMKVSEGNVFLWMMYWAKVSDKHETLNKESMLEKTWDTSK